MAIEDEKLYELAYLVTPDVDESTVTALRDTIDGYVVAQGGSIREHVQSAKQRLAYPIRRKANAYVISEYITLSEKGREAVLKNFQFNKDILRFFMVSITEKYLKNLRQAKSTVTQTARQTTIEKAVKKQASVTTEKPAPERQADISEIEKKLDEILSRES